MTQNPRLVRCLLGALAAGWCCALPAAAHPPASALEWSVDEPPASPDPIVAHARRGTDDGSGVRGPGQIIFDSISGCTTLRSYGGAPAAILDDMSFTPGPASSAGAVVTGMDFYIRTWGPQPRITVRLRFFDAIDPAGTGSPAIVQSEQVSQQFLVIENSPVNSALPTGSYLIAASLAPFVLHGPSFAVEIAYVNDDGEIIANGPLSTVFPGNPCVLSQPVIGSSQDRFWIDNDLGNLTGDNIRYEPPNAGVPGNQGDELIWGGAMPADNVLAVRIHGAPIESSTGACCGSVEPFACTLQTAASCQAIGGVFVGLGAPCTPVFLCVPPPPNDDCGQAAAIAGEGEFPFDTRGASSNGPDDCRRSIPPFGISSDVWFRWTAPCTGQFQLATCGRSITDDRIAAYPSTCEEFASLGCDDDTCPAGFQSWLALDAIAGSPYLLRVGVFPNTPGGQGTLGISLIDGPCAPPCTADFSGNGEVEVGDIFAFLSGWFAQQPEAWFFGGTAGGVPSIFAFLAAWFAHGVGPC